MNRIFWLLIVGLLFVACNNNKGTDSPKNTDLIIQNLKGMVQRTEETSYKVDSTGKIGAMDSCCASIQEFDAKGYNPKYLSKDNNGITKEEAIYNRYEGGQMKEVVMMTNGKKTSSISIQIGKDGKYISAKSFGADGKMDGYYADLKENEYGSLTGGKFYKTDSTLKYSFTAFFDKAINIGSQTDSAGKMISENKLKINDKGDVIEMNSTTITKDSTIHKKETYTYDSYDDKGNWTEKTTYNEKGKPVKVVKRTIIYYKKE